MTHPHVVPPAPQGVQPLPAFVPSRWLRAGDPGPTVETSGQRRQKPREKWDELDELAGEPSRIIENYVWKTHGKTSTLKDRYATTMPTGCNNHAKPMETKPVQHHHFQLHFFETPSADFIN